MEAELNCDEVISNGGAVLSAEVGLRMRMTQVAANAIADDQRQKSVVHTTLYILWQRAYGLVPSHVEQLPLKTGVVAVSNARRAHLLMSRSHPD